MTADMWVRWPMHTPHHILWHPPLGMYAAATDRVLTQSGATPAERSSLEAAAVTDHLPREEALQMLEETCAGGWRGWGACGVWGACGMGSVLHDCMWCVWRSAAR